MEHNQFIQAVDEFRLELHMHGVHHGLLLGFVIQFGVHQELRAKVGGHDQNRVLEVHGPALPVGQTAVVEHLQQHVEYFRIGLFNLIEQHHRIWAATHGLSQLATLLIADVARRSTDQTRHGGLLHVLAHVNAHHGLFIVEQEVGERLGELGLAHAGRAEEQERAGWAVRVGNARTRTTYRIGNRLNGFLLADHTFAEIVFHGQQLLVFALHEASDGNARPVGHDFGHGVGVNAVRHHRNIATQATVSTACRTVLGRRLVLFGLRDLLLDGRNFAIVDGGGFRQIAFAFIPFGLGT